ncbi:MAG: hypothetical protein NTNFB01_07950 [Nitrospira sp.]
MKKGEIQHSPPISDGKAKSSDLQGLMDEMASFGRPRVEAARAVPADYFPVRLLDAKVETRAGRDKEKNLEWSEGQALEKVPALRACEPCSGLAQGSQTGSQI